MDEMIFLRRKPPLGLVGLLVGLPFVLAVGIMPLLVGMESGEILSGMISDLLEDPFHLYLFGGTLLVTGFALPFQLRYEKNAKLVLDAQGVRLRSGFGGRLGRYLERGWPLAWQDIDRAVLSPGPQNKVMELLLIGRDGKRRKIRPEAWRAARDPQRSIPLHFRGLTLADLQAALKTQPLLRQLQAAGVDVEIGGNRLRAELPGTDLTRVPQAVLAIGLLALLGAYGLIDGFIIADYAYAGTLPWDLFFIIGASAALLVFPLLWSSELAKAEAIGLFLMVGLAGGLAAYPGALRINALTDDEGPRVIEYRLESSGRLLADHPAIPALFAPINHDYWLAQERGSRWEIQLYHGGLDFWQYARKPLLADVQAYYERQARDSR